MMSRLDGLRESVARIGSRGTLHRRLAAAGAALAAIGVGLVLLGWYGAAHTPYVFEQMPYLISGGVLGLAFVVAGGFCYFAYWLAHLASETHAATTALERVAELLASRERAGDSPNGTFVATPTGSLYHRPDCAVVTGKQGVRVVSRDDPDLQPCRLCVPSV